MDALFQPDGDHFLPSELTCGPWSPDAQHGGPPTALLARCVERFDGGDSMQVARLTTELLRPVPLSPLTVETRLIRPGRNVQLIQASLFAGESEVARTCGLRIRRNEIELPREHGDRPAPPVGPETLGRSFSTLPGGSQVDVAFHSHAVEHRFVSGAFDQAGPAIDWIRLAVPLVAGEPTPPAARVAAAADFGNGVSWVLPRTEGYTFINPDLTIYLHRLPVSEWICLEAATAAEPHGIGLAESRLWDESGPIGRSLQSLLLGRIESR
jgi:hypothetical protein